MKMATQDWCDVHEIIEKRTRLPIMLLLASGYLLGVMLPIPAWIGPSWLRKLGYWGSVLPVAFLFYSGRDRLLDLMREVNYGNPMELTRADRWYEKLVDVLSIGAAVGMSGLLAFVGGHFAKELGLNLYISVAVGVVIFWGLVGSVAEDIRDRLRSEDGLE